MTNRFSELMTTYRELPGSLKTIVDILAVQVTPIRQKALLSCLKKWNSKDKRVYTAQSLSEAIGALDETGLVGRSPSGVFCGKTVQLGIVRELVTDGQFDSLARLLPSPWPDVLAHGYSRAGEFFRAFQIGLFMTEAEIAVPDVYQYGMEFHPDVFKKVPPLTRYFNRPFSSGVIEMVPLDRRAYVLIQTLSEADTGLSPATELFSYCKEFFVSHDGFLIEKQRFLSYLLLRGELGLHARILPALEDESPEVWAAQMGSRLLLSGETPAALAAFKEALALKKKGTRKRKVFFNDLHGLFFLLAMLKSCDTGTMGEALTHIESSVREASLYTQLFEGLRSIFLDRLGRPQESASGFILSDYSKAPILNFFKFLILLWQNSEASQDLIPEISQLQRQARACGNLWVEAESGMILSRLGKGDSSDAEKIHRSLGTRSLVDIVSYIPPWQKALNALNHLGASLSKDAAVPGPEASQRLIWLLDYRGNTKIPGLVPRLQKRTKKGTWTDGRAVAMKNLYRNARNLEGLTEQDRQVCSFIEEYTYRSNYYRGYPQTEYEFDMAGALAALCGHPLIFLEGALDAPVSLEKSLPEIRLKKGKEGMLISMVPMPGASGMDYVLHRDAPERFRLIAFKESHIAIAGIIGKTGLSVPGEAGDEAARAVTALSSQVAVQSDLALPEGDGDKVPCDTTPRVHIMPWQEGLSAEFRVRPFGDKGASFTPGRGGRHVFMEEAGQTITTTRDLSKESKRAGKVVEGCRSLDGLSPVNGIYQMEDPEQALLFLLEIQSSQEPVVAEWPKGETLRVKRSEVSETSFSMGIKKDRDWFRATGHFALDGEESVALKEILAGLSDARGRFIPLSDGSFLALTESLKERLATLAAYSTPSGDGVKFAPLASLAIEDLTRNAGSLEADEAFQSLCRNFSEPVDYDVPSTLRANLRSYQKEGFSFLSRLWHLQTGACLADDMGLGKTLQALSLLLLGAGEGPSLVVAPLSVMANWQEECARFAPTLNVKFFGPGDREAFLETLGAFDLVITSYGLLQTEAERLAGVSWQIAVLDEAQAIKNRNSKRSRAAMGLCAKFRLITTGTPIENNLDELWALFNFITPGLLGTYNRFRQTYSIPGEGEGKNAVQRRLRKLISPFILRRMKGDVLKDLPQKTEVTLHVEMSHEEALLYEAHRLKAIENIESSASEPSGARHLKILAELTRLRQLCCHPKLVDGTSRVESSKLKVFGDTVDELIKGGHKALVFSQFVSHLSILQEVLDRRKIAYQYLDGATPEKKRRERIHDFQSGKGDLFLISLKAGGSGLNLTAADYVIHMDPWWNPAVEDQASDRAHRIGQTRPVTVYRLVVKDSVEERIMQLHEEKRDLARDLLAGTDMAAKVSAQELLALLKR